MDQLYDFTGPLRSMIIEKASFQRLGPFWKEQRALFSERREYDSTGRLIQIKREEENFLYSYLAGGDGPDPRVAAIYRFDGEESLAGREILYYNSSGSCTGREYYRGEQLVRTVQQEEDPARGVIIEREDGRIKGRQYDRGGRLLSEYIYGGDRADLIRKFSYTEEGHPLAVEETDRNGRPVKRTDYRCNGEGLICEIRESDREGNLLYHRVYDYPRGEDRNWLVREEYALKGRNRKVPLGLVYRSLLFYQEPRLVREETPPAPDPPPPVEVKEEQTLVFPNGYYKGEMRGDVLSGKGVFTFNDGSRYRGDFENGLPQGQGELVKKDGSLYRGSFREGKMHGKGRLEWADGSLYEGAFRQGLMDGLGTFTWPNGDRFKGLFEKGKRTDQGLIERRE